VAGSKPWLLAQALREAEALADRGQAKHLSPIDSSTATTPNWPSDEGIVGSHAR
jgi:hypothetical protein